VFEDALEWQELRGIEQTTGVCDNTVINWVKLAEQALPELENYEIP